MKWFLMRSLVGATLFSVAAVAGAGAQNRKGEVPKEHLPPAGMCRIWIDGVPAGQQPAPTDCASAVKNRPSNGRVLFGDDYAKPNTRKGPPIKRFNDDPPSDPRPPVDSLKPSSKPRRPLIQLIKPPGGR